ncbi:diaminopimelate epimerase [Streptacidiphilus sp. EB129]|uniref:diaminopimelate epimerase n=1 Tax=Streptacidiphilus sp. EB129 TaxID=3156262 RepID=UPI003514952D
MPEFAKYHALGNDYLLIDPNDSEIAPNGESARLLCDRHFGIGADGVLFGPMAPVEAGRPIELQIFNSDGSTCEKSANGIRLFALHIADNYPTGTAAGTEFSVRTLAGDSPVRIRDLDAGLVEIGMGRPSFDVTDVGVTGLEGSTLSWPLEVAGRTLTVTSLHNGNPHTVVFADEVTPRLARELGEAVAGHPRFPSRTNVQFAQVIDRATIRIEIWERGAGYTLASGSSSCAVASAAHALGLVGDRVTVRMPGGELELAIGADGEVTMTGPVEQVLVGDLSPVFRERLGIRRPSRPASEVPA